MENDPMKKISDSDMDKDIFKKLLFGLRGNAGLAIRSGRVMDCGTFREPDQVVK